MFFGHAVLLLASLAPIQEPSVATPSDARGPRAVATRQIAAVGTGDPAWFSKEVDAAAGGGTVLAAFMHGAPPDGDGLFDRIEIRYAFFDGRAWSEGLVDGGDFVCADPAVVYDPASRRYAVIYFKTEGLAFSQADRSVFCRLFDPVEGRFIDAEPRLVLPAPPGGSHDKPWIVVGELSKARRELYVTSFLASLGGGVPPQLAYARSVDGGESWRPARAVNLQGDLMQSFFAPQPAVADRASGAPLFTVVQRNQRWFFHRHDDEFAGPNLDARFAALGVFVRPRRGLSDINMDVEGTGAVKLVPYLIADPTSRDRLFLVFTDVPPGEPPTSSDMDVLCVTVTRDPATDTWSAGPRVRVNDNPFADDSDQFAPAAVVDERGRVHVVFYDNRRYAGGVVSPGCTGRGARYDAFYARSTDHGASFRNALLTDAFDEPSLCETLAGERQLPGEYPGIAVDGNRVWALFAGNSTRDATDDQSVIWAAVISQP